MPGIGVIFFVSIVFILLTKKYLKKLGEINVKLRSNFIKTVNHIFGSFREIKIFKNEKFMLNFFKESLSNEITNIKKVLGLTTGKTYTKEEAKKQLRYGKLLFMTDQDLDGSHIKGLCINMFHSQWHDLVTLPNLFGFMNTPILKIILPLVEKSMGR